MVAIERGAEPEGFRQTAGHTLFVEGSSDDAIDPQVLRLLLRDLPVQIKVMGPSSHIRSVAEALHKHHPHYYFLVDRDHHEQQVVEKCWQHFPDANTCNLLIWRRKELENYFLIPGYISKSEYIACTIDELKHHILQEAQQRIYFDAANMVIIGLREELKRNWIHTFSDAQNFQSHQDALTRLLNHPDFPSRPTDVRSKLDPQEITRRFDALVTNLTGGQSSLQYDCGSWLEMISGKQVLNTIINTCFQVRGQRKPLQGNAARNEVIKALFRLPLVQQPADFQELYTLISTQVKS